jgi:DNA-binding LytR/AlgR family response regulator
VFILTRAEDISLVARPSVHPSGVLLAPPERARLYALIREIYAEQIRTKDDHTPKFTIKTGGEHILISTGSIFFFEAKDKKIALRTENQEISFYSNFDTIIKQLPDWFIRCHKGFVVNTSKIARANLTDMTLTLTDGSVLPMSRSHRQDVSEALNLIGKKADAE